MYVYLTVMFLCCILLYVMRNNTNKITPLAFSFGLIWIMVALQDGWGGDHDSYVLFFDLFHGLSIKDLLEDTTHGEIGFKVFMSIMPSEHFGVIVGMAIWCFAMAFFFYHFIPQKWWFLAIVFVFIDRSILMGMIGSYFRMALANTCLIFAIYSIWKNKRIFSVGLIFLGALFHKSILFMLPLVFVGQKPLRTKPIGVMVFFVMFTIFFMLFPSSWINFVENIVMGIDKFDSFEYYFENQDAIQFKGITLIIVFYWVYLLSTKLCADNLMSKEYLMMYLALIRIAFDLLPAVGMSTRFFYFIDIYYFAGMMCLLNRLSKMDVNIYGIVITLLIMFWYTGFRVYSASEFYKQHWATYNLIF